MSTPAQILLTLAAAFAVGYLFYRLGIPGGLMLGGIVGAAAFNIFTEQGNVPYIARFFAQSVAGGFLGATIDREKLRSLKRLGWPLIIMVAGMFLSDLVIGVLIVWLSPLDPVTALASGIAGGINDVPLIAADLGADAGKVAVLQFVRLMTGIGLVPILIRAADRGAGAGRTERGGAKKSAAASVSIGETLLALAAAMAGGYAGKRIGIPAGTLIFSMFAVALLHLTTGKGRMRPRIKQAAQLLAGAYIGRMLGREDLLELPYLVLPTLVVVAVFVVNCFLSAALIRKSCSMTVRESMLATTPAGAGEIALLSEDLNITQDLAADIMLLHVFRVIAVVSVLPPAIPFLSTLLP